jgi:hypothetical protein
VSAAVPYWQVAVDVPSPATMLPAALPKNLGAPGHEMSKYQFCPGGLLVQVSDLAWELT